MRRLIAVVSLFVLTISAVGVFQSRAAACPVAPPVPLRGMYVNSEIVLVGKIGAPGKWEPLSDGDTGGEARYRIFRRSFPLTVEETLKGTPAKDLKVWETRYSYSYDIAESAENGKPAPKPTPLTEPEGDEGDTSALNADKGRRLFFLTRDDDGRYAEVTKNRYFQPKEKELDIYIERLRELKSIYSITPPSNEAIAEWLVSMAENPVTRFEGVMELRQSLSQLKYEERQKADRANKNSADSDGADEAENDAAEDSAPDASISEIDTDSPEFFSPGGEVARALTAAQKERLINVFLNIRFNYTPPKTEKNEDGEDEYTPRIEVLNETDQLLMQTVAAFDDYRVTGRLLAELPQTALVSPYETSSLMELIAESFDSADLRRTADKFTVVEYNDENELIEDADAAYDLPDEDEEVEESDKEGAKVATVKADVAAPVTEEKVDISQLPAKTYGQRRTELVERFLMQAGGLMAKN